MKKIFFILSILVFSACSDDDTIEAELPSEIPTDEIINIPIVIHVVNYAPDPFEISDEKIKSQIDVLNEDYRKQNADVVNTPFEFMDLVADVNIEFHLAEKNPEGNSTSAILRTSSEVTGWDGKISASDSTPIENHKLYFSDKGGQDAWPADKYLNIWIADLSDRNGNLSLGGYAQFPGADSKIDGIVIDPRVFGTLPPLMPDFELGRTLTHEIGHWLNLFHIYGKDGDCQEGDSVEDTPTQKSQYIGSPVYPQNTCGSNDMFMNFMDRVDDKSMCMFTIGQKERMRDLFNEGGARRELYLNSK